MQNYHFSLLRMCLLAYLDLITAFNDTSIREYYRGVAKGARAPSLNIMMKKTGN